MALLINSTQDKPINIQGTSIELPQIYNRLEFGCRPNGVTMEIAFYTYESRNAFESGSVLLTTVPTGNLIADIDPLTQTQGLQAAHDLAKSYYEGLGYNVVIEL